MSPFEYLLQLNLTLENLKNYLGVCTHVIFIINQIIGDSCVSCNMHLSDEWSQKIIFARNKIVKYLKIKIPLNSSFFKTNKKTLSHYFREILHAFRICLSCKSLMSKDFHCNFIILQRIIILHENVR